MDKSILVRNGLIVTQDAGRRIVKGDVLIEHGLIKDIGDAKDSADIELDAQGGIVMPGLINTHGHVANATMKGLADDLPFPKFLDRVFSIDSNREDWDILAAAELGCMEMVLGGTTTFIDLYYSEDIVAKAVEKVGLRGELCWAVLDQQYTTQKGVPLDNCREFHSKFKDSTLITPGIGLQGVYVCSEETFLGARDLSDSTGALMTFHLSETRKEVYDHKSRTGMRPGDWLDSIGFLNSKCLAAHSAWLTINEVRALARTGASISTCPVSNMKLATGGVAPIPEMQREGVNVTIGTDSSITNNSLDMFSEMKILALLQKSNRWDPTVVSAQEALDFCTINAAKAIGKGSSLGSIEIGKKADLVILNHRSPDLRPMVRENIISNLVYSGSNHDVMTVICEGSIIVKDRQVVNIDQDDVLERSEKAMLSLLG